MRFTDTGLGTICRLATPELRQSLSRKINDSLLGPQ
jgi:hypothetical protein